MQVVLSKLEQTQELDLQIDSIQRKIAEFPIRAEGFQKESLLVSEKIQLKKKQIEELDKSKKQQLGALELNTDREKRSQEKLENIKNNEEYQALTKEIESVKKNSAVIKEAAEKIENEIKAHQQELESLEKKCDEAKAKFESELTKIKSETDGLSVDLGRLQEQRNLLVADIDKKFLFQYDKIRQGKGGLGIALAVSGSCRGCNMKIPPQMYNELLRGSELISCPNCRRILLNKSPSASAPVVQ